MAFKKLNTYTQRWDYIQPYMHNGEAWEEVFHSESNSWYRSSLFIKDEYIGKGTILQRDIRSMPLDPKSDEYAVYMSASTPFTPGGGWGAITSLNTSSQGTQPIHAYLVDSLHPDAHFKAWNGISIGQQSYVKAFQDTYMRGLVPQASWMTPAANGDRGIAIYDVGTGIMREMFSATEGEYRGGGGASVNTPGLKNLAVDNYSLQQTTGISNVAGMHNSLGFIGISEVLMGEINHALCFTAGALRMLNDDGTERVSWPARASDGKLEVFMPEHPLYRGRGNWQGGRYTPTHGQWGRVRADYDPEVNHKTGKKNGKLLQMVIRAAQKYGIVATDTNLWCHAFNAEQGVSWKHAYGADPWSRDGTIAQLLKDPDTGIPDLSVNDFPWDKTEWAPIDWGRPSPDYTYRPNQFNPWFRKHDQNGNNISR